MMDPPPQSNKRPNSMKPPQRRRSSITAVALEEMGSSFSTRKSMDAMKNPPGSVRRNQTERINVAPRIPEEATPVLNRGNQMKTGRMNPQSAPSQKPRTQGRSLIPTPLTSRTVLSKTVVRVAPSTLLTRARLPSIDQRRHGGSQVLTARKPPPQRCASNLGSAFSAVKSARQGPKRSTSMESFATSFFSTTCATPRNPRRLNTFSFGLSTGKKPVFCTKSAENLHRSSTNEPIQKTLKVPSSADKKFVNRMAFVVVDVLQDFEYPKMISVSEFNKMSVMEFFNICQYFLQGIQLPKFSGNKVDELIPQLLELTTTLKYPGTLTKSVLKTVNTPHSWPAAVTFLVWLACRITAMCTCRSFGSKLNSVAAIGDEADLCFTELFTDAFRRMYSKHIRHVDDEFEAEIQEYRKRIMEAYLFGQDETVASLTAILTERQNQFSVLAAVIDPSLEVLENTKASLDKVSAVQSRQVELANLLLKYKNTDHHKSQSRTLEKKILVEQERCDQIAVELRQQPLDLQGLETLNAEIEDFKNQQNSLVQVIGLMKNKLKIKQQVVKNYGNLFYQVCEKFRIVDDFNEHLGSFEKAGLLGNMERIKMNPFNLAEFDIWLKDLRRILRHTERIISELKLNLEHDWKNDDKLKREKITEDIKRCEAESAAINIEIEALREDGLNERHHLKMIEAGRLEEIKEVQQLIGMLNRDLKDEEIQIDNLTRMMAVQGQRNQALMEEAKASDAEVEEAYYESRNQKCKIYQKYFSDVAKIVLARRARFPNILNDDVKRITDQKIEVGNLIHPHHLASESAPLGRSRRSTLGRTELKSDDSSSPMDSGDSVSTFDVSMTSPPNTGNEDSFNPNVDLFISRKNRIINSPNVNFNVTTENNTSQGTSAQQLVSTPLASGGVAAKKAKRSRRDDLRVNPFEKHLLEQLHRSVWSPSILQETISDTPPQRDWSVDQMSLLNPSKIEESPSTHQNEEILTPQTEARAQHAITRFFSEHIVPSPPSSPITSVNISNKMDEGREDLHPSLNNEAVASKSTNTDISFPLVLPPDVEQILLSFSTPVVPEGDSASVNTSLRRRKLDFTLSPTGTPGNIMEITPTSGETHHSPGIHRGDVMSPRQFRHGLESPNFTPIRGSN